MEALLTTIYMYKIQKKVFHLSLPFYILVCSGIK